MLHPSYTELMDAVNSEVKEGEQRSSAADILSLLQLPSVQGRLLQVQNLQFRIIRTKSHFPLQLKNLWTEMLRSFKRRGCG